MLSARVDHRRLREIREDRELTTTQVAALLSAELGRKVHQSTVSKWERGAREPGARSFGALCRVLRIPKSEVLIPKRPQVDEAGA